MELAGKRVLESGPASGGLTFYMERCGAEVVSTEAPDSYRMEYRWDIPSCVPPDFEKRVAESKAGLRALHNSDWLCHKEFSSRAKIYYRSAYEIPGAFGTFDIATIGCVLLHNKSPHLILEGAARVTRRSIIVIEILPPNADQEGMLFLRKDTSFYDGWFHWPPKLTVKVLKSMGFGDSKVTIHTEMMGGKPYQLYTVTASRE